MGIAVGIEEDGLGGEELAASVDLDCAAFEDHSAFETGQAEGGGDAFGYCVVEIPGAEFPAPCIEFPIGDGE